MPCQFPFWHERTWPIPTWSASEEERKVLIRGRGSVITQLGLGRTAGALATRSSRPLTESARLRHDDGVARGVNEAREVITLLVYGGDKPMALTARPQQPNGPRIAVLSRG